MQPHTHRSRGYIPTCHCWNARQKTLNSLYTFRGQRSVIKSALAGIIHTSLQQEYCAMNSIQGPLSKYIHCGIKITTNWMCHTGWSWLRILFFVAHFWLCVLDGVCCKYTHMLAYSDASWQHPLVFPVWLPLRLIPCVTPSPPSLCETMMSTRMMKQMMSFSFVISPCTY